MEFWFGLTRPQILIFVKALNNHLCVDIMTQWGTDLRPIGFCPTHIHYLVVGRGISIMKKEHNVQYKTC